MCYGYHIWSKEPLMQVENDDDLDGGQRSSEVKWGKLCVMATIFGQKKCWCKLRLMPIKYLCIIYAKICPEHFLGTVCPTKMIFGMWVGLGPKVRMVTLMEVKGHQSSNGVNYVLWLPYLVKRTADASWEWWWPWWRSKVIRGQMG